MKKKMSKFRDLSTQDLMDITVSLHKIAPDLTNCVVFGVEEHQEEDQNVVFHLMPMDDPDDVDKRFTKYISSDYIVEIFKPEQEG